MTVKRKWNNLLARITGAAVLVLVGGPALADAIDGQWCDPAGKNMKIDGSTIVTPGGAKIQGNYSRHSFTYVVPAKEPGAGQTIYMQLLGEEDLDVSSGSPVAKPVRWKRCETIS